MLPERRHYVHRCRGCDRVTDSDSPSPLWLSCPGCGATSYEVEPPEDEGEAGDDPWEHEGIADTRDEHSEWL